MKMRFVYDIKFFVTGHNKQVDRIFDFGCATVGRQFGVAENQSPTPLLATSNDHVNISGNYQRCPNHIRPKLAQKGV
jgi:hypothetical protein